MPETGGLIMRSPTLADENQAMAADAELAVDGFNFALRHPAATWPEYLAKVARDREGIDLAPGRVAATMLFALVEDSRGDEELVGRVHIRHTLTPELLAVGGHIGYGVRPAHRGKGYATQMLLRGLRVLSDLGLERALVTCDDGNLGSQRTIERCGGVLENIDSTSVVPKRRYWIDLLKPPSAGVGIRPHALEN